jgi:DNA-directed RNA polymerase subunit K/omega
MREALAADAAARAGLEPEPEAGKGGEMSTRNVDDWMPEWMEDGLADEHVRVNMAATRPMTKFERATIVGHRASQIAQGSTPRVHCASSNVVDVASAEVDAGTIRGMRVIRYLPDGTPVQKTVDDILPTRLRVRQW